MFYDVARRLTKAHGSLLIVDSIQAGFRGTGYLSIVDYPGFEDSEVPDMESWSKALNAGQYPLSVLGLSEKTAAFYVRGMYGNTMTSNPRALEVGAAVLESVTEELRENIRARGAELVGRLLELRREFPDVVQRVQGTGLIVSAHIDPDKLAVVGFDGLETWCRRHGLGVIHGGKNALRFTPHFAITSEEIRAHRAGGAPGAAGGVVGADDAGASPRGRGRAVGTAHRGTCRRARPRPSGRARCPSPSRSRSRSPAARRRGSPRSPATSPTTRRSPPAGP